jgi:hypothetical protein
MGDEAEENPPPDIPALAKAAQEAGSGRLCLSSQGNTPYAPVGRGKMGDAGMAALAGYLTASVTDLALDNAGLTESGVEALAGVLDQGVCRLTKLVLRHNLCADRGCVALAAGLGKPESSVLHLELAKNKIGAEGAAALGEALRANSTLTYLGMSQNPIGDAGCAAIADAVGGNTGSGLLRLDLSQCSFGDEGATALADALETDGGKQWGTQISALFLGRNAITDEGADVLADALEDSIFLKELYLGGCRIKDRGAKLLVDCLKINASVINLNIGDNVRITSDLAHALPSPPAALSCLRRPRCELTQAAWNGPDCIADQGTDAACDRIGIGGEESGTGETRAEPPPGEGEGDQARGAGRGADGSVGIGQSKRRRRRGRSRAGAGTRSGARARTRTRAGAGAGAGAGAAGRGGCSRAGA